MATKKETHAQALADLFAMLRADALTVVEIAARFGCSRSAAYARLNALTPTLPHGFGLEQTPDHTGRRGPRAVRFAIRALSIPSYDANGSPAEQADLDLGTYSPPLT